ncbi:hypothetical protein L226DRAFT_176007 [Lentinus tigrinus ALCF2SS1-7]|uniref:uncharacterized protein n=1 Tax=Lentinus tigrinus ALCF2SS1-7 TaxID=1328758 RepID=UPI00116625C6|nr:hypothetical protein L226DRAFT_176007 [Lentinus tigrinus ALCF2SS1-7]
MSACPTFSENPFYAGLPSPLSRTLPFSSFDPHAHRQPSRTAEIRPEQTRTRCSAQAPGSAGTAGIQAKYAPTNDVDVVCPAVAVPELLAAGASVGVPPSPSMVPLAGFVPEDIAEPSRDARIVAVDPESPPEFELVSADPGALADSRPDVGADGGMAADTLSIAADALAMAADALDSAAAALEKAADSSTVRDVDGYAPLACTVVVVVVREVMVVTDTDAASGLGYGFGIACRLLTPCSPPSVVGLLGAMEVEEVGIVDVPAAGELAALASTVGAVATPVAESASIPDASGSVPSG